MLLWVADFFWQPARWLQEYNGAVTALATIVIAVFTIVLAIVTRRQAILTRKSVGIAERALVTTERAFVFLEDFVPEWQAHPRGGSTIEFSRFEIMPRWRNSGTTPTRNMEIRINWTHWSGDNQTGIGVYAENTKPARMFLGPQATEWSEAIKIPGNIATAALQRKEQILIWGRADYEDIFDGSNPHFTEWCYRLSIIHEGGRIETRFVAFSDYNRSD